VFLKRIAIRKNGKRHTYWALVKSVRTARGPRHQVVSYLGELAPGAKAGWAHVGRIARRPQPAQLNLFNDIGPSDPVPEKVEVHIRRARVERTRDFGDLSLGLLLWQTLELDGLLDRKIERGRSRIPRPLMAAVSTLARFCEGTSRSHLEEEGRLARLGTTQRRVLRLAYELDRLEGGGSLESVHSVDPSGVSVQNAEIGVAPASHPAPSRGPRTGAHLVLLPGLRPVENVGTMDGALRTRQRPTHGHRGVPTNQVHGCRASHVRGTRRAHPLHHHAGRSPTHPPRWPRRPTARATGRTPRACWRCRL